MLYFYFHRNSAVKMYRQHQKSAKDIGDQTAVMIGKVRGGDGVSISNSFRVNLKVKNFISQKAPQDVDLVISIYEVTDENSFPKALCENFVVKGWKTKNGGEEDLKTRENLRAVFGDIYKVCICKIKLALF